MSTLSHIRLPDSLLEDPRFNDALLEHQMIFIYMIRLAAFKPQKYNIRGHIIQLLPGQLCYSERAIAEICGKHCTKDLVRGTIKYFLKCHFLHQQVHHKKNVITLTHPEVYKLITNDSPPASPPEVHQQSTINNKSIPNIQNKHVVGVARTHAHEIPLTIEKQHTSGTILKISLEDVFNISVIQRKDWSTEEINDAWLVLCDYTSPISDALAFISGVINKKRVINNSNKPKETKKCPTENISKPKPEIINDFYAESDMSESPLAKYSRQIGLS